MCKYTRITVRPVWKLKYGKTEMVTCIYQSVQGVVDLMDACQCSQMRIQLKICITNSKKKKKTSFQNQDINLFVVILLNIVGERDLRASPTNKVCFNGSDSALISTLMRKTTEKYLTRLREWLCRFLELRANSNIYEQCMRTWPQNVTDTALATNQR